jgi:hypothetical protein
MRKIYNVNRKLKMNTTAYLVTLFKLVRKTKKAVSEMKMNGENDYE